MILCGWNDGSVGPLIPRLQEYYGINYLIMSLLFIMMFVGSLIAGLTNVWLTDRLGFGLVTPLGAMGTVICYLFAGTGGPYPLFLIGYVFNGFGLGLQDAQVNNVVSRLPGAGSKMSIVQACFSVGGTIAPFISTAFAQHVDQVYRYFFVAMGIGIMTIVIMLLAFQGKTEEQIVSKLQIEGEEREGEVVEMQTGEEKDVVVVAPTEAILPPVLQTSGAKMKRIFSSPAAWTLMSFAFLYVSGRYEWTEREGRRRGSPVWMANHLPHQGERRQRSCRICCDWFLGRHDCRTHCSHSSDKEIGISGLHLHLVSLDIASLTLVLLLLWVLN